jgi:hypothetical protein
MAMNTKISTLILIIGCSGSAQGIAAPPASQVEPAAETSRVPGPPASTAAATEPEVVPATPSPPARPAKDQPPHIKLKLGHYRNVRLGIGVTIDLTETTENVADIDPAKVRFDGDPKVWRLEGEHGGYDRIDYRAGKRLILQVWEDGRRVVYVPDPDTGRSSGEVEVRRDGDADPL